MVSRAPQVEALEDRRLLAVFSDASSITINDDAIASPYPATINVSGLTGNVIDLDVTLHDFAHQFPDDVGVLLVAPGGQTTLLIGDSGGGTDVTDLNLTFDDSAATSLPDGSTLVSGTFRPTLGVSSIGTLPADFPAPAPAGPYGATLAAINGSPANGDWNLHVLDDAGSDDGSIDSGWSLDIITADPVFSGTTGDNEFVFRVNATDNSQVDVVIDGDTRTFPLAGLNSLTINGDNGNDELTVDYSNGNPIPAGGIFFNGQGQTAGNGDALTIAGGPFTTQTLSYTTTGADGNNGNVDLDGSLITYTGLEPINAGNAADTILNLPTGSANDAMLQDSGNADEIEIIDNGATFENTVIPNPTNSLTVNLGDQGDQLQVNPLDAAFAASLIINGGAADSDNVLLSNVDLDTAGVGRGLLVTETETLGITGGAIENNSAVSGGGIFIENSTSGTITTATITGTTIASNTATGGAAPLQGGGGIYNDGANLTISGNTMITGNTATAGQGSGGGVVSTGTLTVNGSTISGNSANRAGGGIEISSGSGLTTLTNVTLDNNDALGAPGNGGGLHVTGTGNVNISGGTVNGNSAALEGGGLWNGSGMMVVDGTVIDGNTASGAAADQGGGGVFNAGGTVTLQNGVQVTNNIANGAAGSGGGILNDAGGTLTVTNSTVSGNTANRAGGGIEDNAGTLNSIVDSTISNNNAGNSPGNGGGIHISGAGTVEIDGSTINGNTAVEGGGLWNSGSGTFTVTNTTISGNDATGSDGGGIFNTDGGTIDLDSVTITLNDASTSNGSGIAGGTGGVTITNTIVAQNPGGGTEANLNGSINTVDDFNLIGDPDDGTLSGNTANTVFAANALLLPLTSNSGPTQTHLPASGSPAIGFGNTVLTVDQRDVVRPQGAEDDIGAVEVDLDGFVIDADDLATGTAGDGNPDEFLITNEDSDPDGDVQVFVNDRLVFNQPKATTGLILIRGSADDDKLTVDNSNGLIGANIVFDGDGMGRSSANGTFPTAGGFDKLVLLGETPVETTYNPGETADAGALFQENGAIVQRVEFFGLEPVQVLAPVAGNNVLNVASAPLGIGFPQALQGQNSINYTEGPNSNDGADPVFAGALTGLITVDGFESLEFANFEVLNIDAGAGSDEINLNNPVIPDELGEINVDGGDPNAGSDLLTVQMFGGGGNDLLVGNIRLGGATLTGGGLDTDPADDFTMDIDGIEELVLDGGNEDIDLTIQGSEFDTEVFLHTPGPGLDSGWVAFSDIIDGGTNNAGELLDVRYENLGSDEFGQPTGTLTLDGQGSGGASDRVVFLGTAADDEFTISWTATDTTDVELSSPIGAHIPVQTIDVRDVRIDSLDGDDRFDIQGPVDLTANGSLRIAGGSSGLGSDVLDFTGGGQDVTLDLEAQTITETGFAPVSYSGVETVNIDADAALIVNGGTADDTISVTPTTAGNNGTFTHNQSPGATFNYRNAATITFNGALGENELIVRGNADANTITSTPNTVSVDGSEVTLGGGFDSIQVLGLGANDDIDLSNLGAGLAGEYTIRGGGGNDSIVGTLQPDSIFGDEGNDDLIGAGGNDFIYGGLGNDTIGGDDPGADDPGNDFFFGGDGSDLFIWEPGDGQDTISGGDDGNDIFEFRGRGQAGDTMTLAPDGAGVDANFNAATINVAGVEDFIVAPGDGGSADVIIENLFGTEMTEVDVQLPSAGNADTVDVDGRAVADDLTVSIDGIDVLVSGLSYDISISGGVAVEDRLTVNGFGGDDSIKAEAGVEATIDITLNGGNGDDFLSADAILNGGAGDDTLIGGAGDDTLDGGAGDDVLDGRGGNNTLIGGAGEDAVLVSGTAGPDTITSTHTPGVLPMSTLDITGGLSAGSNTLPDFDIEVVSFELGNEDDDLTINAATIAPLDYSVDGGQGSDLVTMQGNPDVDEVIYTPGAAITDGRLSYEDPADATLFTMDFTNLEPVVDLIAAATLTVNGTNAANAINYSPGTIAANGLVSVDGFETIEFSNKAALTLNGLAGSDEINLNNDAVPTALTAINVVGGDPTAGSDLVVVNGTTGQDTITVDTLTIDGATVTGAQPVPVNVDTAEQLIVNGRGGQDDLLFTTPNGNDSIQYTPGLLPDSGSIVAQDLDIGPERLLPTEFRDLGQLGSSVTFLSDGGTREDILFIEGTNNNDTFVVDNNDGVSVEDSAGVPFTPEIVTTDIDNLILQGLAGDDTFDVAGDHPYSDALQVEGGNPGSGSDELNFNGAGAVLTIDLGVQSITETGFGAVVHAGIETANVNAAIASVTVNGTAADDTTVVTPTGASAATLINNALSPTFNLSLIGDLLVDQQGGDDTLRVEYTSTDETVAVNVPAGSISDGTLETVTFANANTEAVEVFGNQGDDTFNVTSDPNIPIFIDGGDPIGSTPGDTLNLLAGGGAVIAETGPENDEGSLFVAGNQRVSFDHIEALGVMMAMKAYIAGTDGDDDITIIARDASTHAGTDGVQDFTTTVNDGLSILWIDTPQIIVDALGGDDDIVARVPAPNNADWNVEAWILGGAPAAGPGDDGDRFVLETPQTSGPDAILYTPTSVDGGTLVIDEGATGAYVPATDTIFNLGVVPPAMVGVPVPDPGGIETLVYDGGSGDDVLRVFGDGTADTNDNFQHVPGAARDQGFVGANANNDTLLGIHYENLGIAGFITVDGLTGTNSLTALGSAATDSVDLDFSTPNAIDIDLTTAAGLHVDLQSANVQDYAIDLLDGDDDITVNGLVDADSLVIHGGSPSGGSDTLELNAADDPADNTLVIAPDGSSPDDQDITGLGAPIDVVGVELINFFGGQADTLNVQLGDGDNDARVERGSDVLGVDADLVTSDSLPDIQFAGLDAFTVEAGPGADVVTFKTWFLAGSTNTNYGFAGIGTDTLTLEGNEALADDIDVTSPAAGQVALTDNNGTNVTVTTVVGALPGAIEVHALGGDDLVELDDLDLDDPAPSITIFGGTGDDVLDGSTRGAKPGVTDDDVRLTLLGGDGDDELFGADSATGSAVGDRLDGGAGDDLLEGGRGRDEFLGGDGSDYFVWVAGDGSDLMEGGSGETDQLIFIANDGSNLLQLYGGGLFNDSLAGFFPPQTLENSTRAIFELNAGQVFLNTGDVESIYIDALGGDDNIVINNQVDTVSRGDAPTLVPAVGAGVAISRGTDLAPTSVESVEVLDGTGDDYIDLHGTATDDNIDVAVQGGATVVEGASVFVQIQGVGENNTLHVHGQTGDDDLKAADGTEAAIQITLEGDTGEDLLSADAILIGGPDDDFLQGGAGDDLLFGNAGEDTMVGGAGNDTFDGGEDFDTILISGTSDEDIIDVFQAAPTTLNHTVNGVAEVDTLVLDPGTSDGTVEQARIEAGEGADLIRVNWLDAHAINGPDDALRYTVHGGADSTSDRLVVVDDGTDDLVLLRQGQEDDEGTVEVGPGNTDTDEEPFLAVFDEIERVDFVDENGAAIDNLGGPQLVVFKHDPFEANDDRFNATYLGSDTTINVDPTIDPGPVANPFNDDQDLPGDSDWYRVVAETTGTLDFQVYFRQLGDLASGRPGLPNDGNLDITVVDAAGNAIAGFGSNDEGGTADDDERVRIPAVEGQTYYLGVSGADDAINVYNVTVVNHAPPTPYAMELLDNPPDETTNPPGGSVNSDTGRSQFDNHTYDNTPTLFFRLDDGTFLYDIQGNTPPLTNNPPDETIVIPFQAGLAQPNQPGFAIAIFDEGDTLPQNATAPQTPLGFASATGQDGVYTFTVPAALSDGSHFLTARVQMIDPADPQQTGFGPRSEAFEIVVDTQPPPVSFGDPTVADDGLHPNSDSGSADPLSADTLIDRATNDVTPTFFGRAEANSIVRAYVDLNNNGDVDPGDVLIGQTVATPLDGTNQHPNGEWELTSNINMNDPDEFGALGFDGLRRILVTAEDVAGNITPADQAIELQIFVDTQGPQIFDPDDGGPLQAIQVVTDGITNGTFNLFSLKPETPEPTPRVDGLVINVRDFPERAAGFLYDALSNPVAVGPSPVPEGLISVVGDHSGIIELVSAVFTPDPEPNAVDAEASGFITLSFDEPLPDDRFTLTLSEDLIDPVGNKLDGESNASEPNGEPVFPSGDSIPGGDFVARFTVDSRPEVATWAQGSVYVDINGNFVWDPEGQDNDATNRDFAYRFGDLLTDAFFVGNFNAAGGGNASGFDKLGVYGKLNGVYQFFLDLDDDGVGDLVTTPDVQVIAIPVAGDFAPGHDGDEIGLFDGQNWYLDVDGNNNIEADEQFATNMRGIPFVGDFNGDGNDDLATFNNDTGDFQFNLDVTDGNVASVDETITDFFGTFGFSGFGERPVAGDFNLDGIDDIGLYVPHQEGVLPKQAGEFHFLLSDPGTHPVVNPPNTTVASQFQPFSPAPLGNDLIAQFGDDVALPLFGNFDPPISQDGSQSNSASLTNESNPLDTNVDGEVSALDALVVINAMARGDLNTGANPLRVIASLGGYRLDASGDGDITALDALRVINGLRELNGEAEANLDNGSAAAWAGAADQAIGDFDDDDDELLLMLSEDQARTGL